MPELNIEKFNPAKAEIAAAVAEAQGLTIAGVNDVVGYQRVHETRMKLKSMRVQISKTGKEMRADAIAFQKQVIEKENEFIALIDPAEKDLKAKEDAIDHEREVAKRRELLPARKNALTTIGVEADDASILNMDDDQFNSFFNTEKEKWLAAKEAKLKADEEALIAEKNRIAAEEQRKAELEQARKEGEERARAEAEAKAQADKEAAIAAEIKRKQDEEAQAERNRQEAEAKAKADEDAKIAEQKRVESVRAYQEFLRVHGYTAENKDQFKIERTGNNVVLYKKVAELTL